MPRNTSRLARLLLVPLALFAIASPALAKNSKDAPKDMKKVCEAELRKRIKANHPNAKNISTTVSREWQQTSTQSGVGGTGELTGNANKKHQFEWTCVYDTKTGKILDMDLDKNKGKKAASDETPAPAPVGTPAPAPATAPAPAATPK